MHRPAHGSTCRELVELVTGYLDASLEPELLASVERHLEACRGCAVYLEQMRQLIRALGRLPAGW